MKSTPKDLQVSLGSGHVKFWLGLPKAAALEARPRTARLVDRKDIVVIVDVCLVVQEGEIIQARVND